MIEVTSGRDDVRAMQTRHLMENFFIARGMGVRFIPLNGGSDTRRDAREWHEQQARAGLIPYNTYSSHCIIGGFIPNTLRGWRYMIGRRKAQWMHWRKAKRILRRNAGRVVPVGGRGGR